MGILNDSSSIERHKFEVRLGWFWLIMGILIFAYYYFTGLEFIWALISYYIAAFSIILFIAAISRKIQKTSVPRFFLIQASSGVFLDSAIILYIIFLPQVLISLILEKILLKK